MKISLPLKLSKTLSVTLSLFTAIGILFSLILIFFNWVFYNSISKQSKTIFSQVDQILSTTEQGIIVVNDALEKVDTGHGLIVTTINNISVSLESLGPVLDSSSNIIGDEFSEIISNTQDSINSAALSSKIIDDTLILISRIPLLGLDYTSNVPLHTSLEELSGKLDGVPQSLDNLRSGINETARDIETVAGDIGKLSTDLDDLKSIIDDSKQVTSEYLRIISELKTSLENFESRFPFFLLIITFIITYIIIWEVIIQGIVLIYSISYTQKLSSSLFSNKTEKNKKQETQ